MPGIPLEFRWSPSAVIISSSLRERRGAGHRSLLRQREARGKYSRHDNIESRSWGRGYSQLTQHHQGLSDKVNTLRVQRWSSVENLKTTVSKAAWTRSRHNPTSKDRKTSPLDKRPLAFSVSQRVSKGQPLLCACTQRLVRHHTLCYHHCTGAETDWF